MVWGLEPPFSGSPTSLGLLIHLPEMRSWLPAPWPCPGPAAAPHSHRQAPGQEGWLRCMCSTCRMERQSYRHLGRVYTHPMNILAWGSVTLNSKWKTLWQVQRKTAEKRENVCLFFEQETPHFHFASKAYKNYMSVPTHSLLFITTRVGGWMRNVGPLTYEYGKSFFCLNAQKAGPYRPALLSTGIAYWLYLSPRNILAKAPSNDDHI